LIGMISEAEFPANSTAMSYVCPPNIRQKGFALRRLATNLGVTIGPVLGGTLAVIDYKLIFWVDGMTCVAASLLLVLLFKHKEPFLSKKKSSPEPVYSIKKDVYFFKILGLVFLIGLIFVQLYNTFPLYLKQFYLLTENRIGQLFAINTVLIVLFEMVLINHLKNRSMHKIIATGALILGLGFALLPLGKSFCFGALAVFIWTWGEMMALPTLTALVANHSVDAMRGRYMGMFGFAFAFAMVIGPSLGAAIYEKLSPDILWLFVGSIGFLVFLGFFFLENQHTSSFKQ
jgi:MFS family permease